MHIWIKADTHIVNKTYVCNGEQLMRRCDTKREFIDYSELNDFFFFIKRSLEPRSLIVDRRTKMTWT